MEFSGHTYKMLAEGQRVFPDGTEFPDGRFVLEEMVGEGGMGVVWRAMDEKLEQVVALKFVPDRLRTDGEALEQLKSEAIKGRRLTHQNIVAVYDFLQSKEHAAVSMEYASGLPLSVMKARAEGHCFEVDEITGWVEQMCEALEYAHTRGGKAVVHRDLKPSNLLTSEQGELKVADFGIARTLADSFARVSNVAMGGGTLGYCSPQQLNGKPPRVSDDVYSIGATIYDLLTATAPFYTGDIPYQTRNEAPIPMAERRVDNEVEGKGVIPAGWEDVVARCLSKEPAGRPSSCGEILYLLGLNKQYAPKPAATPPTLPPQAVAPEVAEPATAATAPTSAPVEVATSVFASDEPKKSALGLWVALIVLAVLGVGGGVAVALMSKKDDPDVPVAGNPGSSTVVSSVVKDPESKEAARLISEAKSLWAKRDWKGAGEKLDVYRKAGFDWGAQSEVVTLSQEIAEYVNNATGRVTVQSDQPGARYFVDGKQVNAGTVAVRGLGRHEILVTAAGFEMKKESFVLNTPNTTVSVATFRLEPTRESVAARAAESERLRQEGMNRDAEARRLRQEQMDRDAEAKARAERLAAVLREQEKAKQGGLGSGSLRQERLGPGPASKVYNGQVGGSSAVWSVRWKNDKTIDGGALRRSGGPELRFVGTNYVDGQIIIRMTEWDGRTEKSLGSTTLRKSIRGDKIGWSGTAQDGRSLYFYRDAGRSSQERFVSSYLGKVNDSTVDVSLTWGSDHSVSGSYRSRSSGKNYVLKGDNIAEGVVYLDEYTGGALSARVLLRKGKVGGSIRWSGTMYNMDGRMVPMSIWKK